MMSFKLDKSYAGRVVSDQAENCAVLGDMFYFIRDHAPDRLGDAVDTVLCPLMNGHVSNLNTRNQIVASLVDTDLPKILAEITPDGSRFEYDPDEHKWQYTKVVPTHIICVYLHPEVCKRLSIPSGKPLVWHDALDFDPYQDDLKVAEYLVLKLNTKDALSGVVLQDISWSTFLTATTEPTIAL
jgi:hypothetical protein